MPPPDVVAAGAIVTDGSGHVLMVHRPTYDDWSWPKGKQDPGEHICATAVREVLEETGVEIRLGMPLPDRDYVTSSGRSKRVHYWVGYVVGDIDVSSYAANAEIDEVAWVPLAAAHRRLTYGADRALLDHADLRPTRALVVLRHARARKRDRWDGTDHDRPLTRRGQEQARALVPVLAAYGISVVVSSDSMRCVQTVAPYATDQVLPVQALAELSEENATPAALRATAADLLALDQDTVLCNHRPSLPTLLDAVGFAGSPLSPAEFVVTHHRAGPHPVATERHLAG